MVWVPRRVPRWVIAGYPRRNPLGFFRTPAALPVLGSNGGPDPCLGYLFFGSWVGPDAIPNIEELRQNLPDFHPSFDRHPGNRRKLVIVVGKGSAGGVIVHQKQQICAVAFRRQAAGLPKVGPHVKWKPDIRLGFCHYLPSRSGRQATADTSPDLSARKQGTRRLGYCLVAGRTYSRPWYARVVAGQTIPVNVKTSTRSSTGMVSIERHWSVTASAITPPSRPHWVGPNAPW